MAKKVLDLLFENPLGVGYCAGLLSFPLAIAAIRAILSKQELLTEQDALALGGCVSLPMAAVATTSLGLYTLGAFVWDSKNRERTRRGDYGRLRTLEQSVQGITPPTVGLGEEVQVKYSLGEFVKERARLTADGIRELSRQHKNPGLAFDAARRFFNVDRLDEGIECLRDAYDWLDGKRPVVSFAMGASSRFNRIATKLQCLIEVRDVSNYMSLAGQAGMCRPDDAFYWSELGRRVADEFASQRRKEMYVFHALLASAQRRSDEQSAWHDALQLLMAESQVESASERESRSEVFRFNGDFFANTLVVKRRPDLASLVREYDWQLRGKSVASHCDVPEPVYVSKSADGLSCFAMRYRNGEVLYDLLEKGDKSSVAGVAGALGEIHAKVSHDGLNRVEIWKKARDKLYDSLLGIPKDLANTILAHYGPIEKGCWLAPAVINKDAHPEQWIVGDRLTAIDWEIDALVPLTFDSANFTSYRDFFSPPEQKEFVGSHVAAYKQNGGDMRGEDVFTSFYNAVIHRMICFIGAWSAPTRKRMRAYRGEALSRAIGAIDALECASPEFYAKHEDDYCMLRKSFTKVADLLVP